MPLSKTVSVIVPTYNRERYIIGALESILAQNLPPGWSLEIIVADDGSTDGTTDVLKKYKNKMKLIKMKHSGKPAVPRNAAIAAASGDLLAFQDSDDLWAPNKLAKQLPIFDDPKIMISFGQAEVIDQDGKETGRLVVDSKELPQVTGFEKLLKQNSISTLTVIARKKAILEVGGFDESDDLRAVEDYHLWLKIAAKFPDSLKPLKDTLAYYRVHDMNISKATNAEALRKIITVISKVESSGILSKKQASATEKRLMILEENWSRQANSDTKPPTITVLMSVYNGEKFLKPAIDSILNQKFKDFEFLIINDGSKDKTRKIVESYQKKDKRIRLINQVNHGFIYSLNKGVRLARAEFIARMDADDISLPARLSEQVKLLNANPRLGAVSTYFELIDFETGKPLSITMTPPVNALDLKRALYIVNPMAHGATTFRKQAWLEAGPYSKEYAPAEDYDLWRKISQNWDIGVVPKVLFQYRINNPNSMSQANTEVQENNARKIRTELINERFVRKSLFAIISDYKELDQAKYGKHASRVKNEYINQQYGIANTFLDYSAPAKAFTAALSILIIKPAYFPSLLKKYPRSIYQNLRRRLKLG